MRVQTLPHSVEENARQAGAGRALVWLWLIVPIAILLTVTALAGLFVPGVYHDPPAWAVQAVAQDFTNLVAVLPVLVVSAVLVARGSWRARLICLGALSYLVYAFVIYAFAVHYNRLFLTYVAVLGCSLWAFIGGMATTDWARVKAQFAANTPVKSVSVFLLVLAVLFYLIWLSEEVTALVAGSVAASVDGTGLLTNPVHVLDLSTMLPALALAGIWLWRKQAIGYGLAGILLMNAFFQDVGIIAVMVFSIRAGLPGEPALVAVFVAVAATTLALLVWFLRGMQPPAM